MAVFVTCGTAVFATYGVDVLAETAVFVACGVGVLVGMATQALDGKVDIENTPGGGVGGITQFLRQGNNLAMIIDLFQSNLLQ